MNRKEFAELLEKYGSNGSTGSTRNSPIQQGRQIPAVQFVWYTQCILMFFKVGGSPAHLNVCEIEFLCSHSNSPSLSQSAWTASCVCTVLNKKKRPFYFWVLSLKGRWSKSAFKNSLWQVHLSITQLPTSVSVGSRQPAGTDLLEYDFSARVQSCVLCVEDGLETARGHQPQNYNTFQFKAKMYYVWSMLNLNVLCVQVKFVNNTPASSVLYWIRLPYYLIF